MTQSLTPVDRAALLAAASLTGKPDATAAALAISHNITRYATVTSQTGVPWWWIGCIHQMEAGGRFSCHLHNGDPLSARTVHEPPGRPLTGKPPFTWEQSAADALQMEGLRAGVVHDIDSALDRAERYNGLGYRRAGKFSPYLWSGTNWAQPGKYTADHVFDPLATSEQPGVAALMLALQKLNVTLFL